MAEAESRSGSDPNGAQAASLISRARALVDANNPTDAIEVLRQAIALPDCSAQDRLGIAPLFVAAGAKPEAVACYLEAGTRFLYDEGDMARARAAFAQGHQLDASNLDIVFLMGQADVVEGRTQDALAKFIDVLRKSNLKHVPALFEAGCIYQSNGQYDQAILAFKKVLDRERGHVQAIVHMGQLHQIKGMVPESLGYYMQAADIARENKQYGTSRQLLNMVLALDGGNQKARIMLDDLDDHDSEADVEDAAGAVPAPSMKVEKPAAATSAATPAATARDMTGAVGDAKKALDALVEQRDELQREMEELSGARLDAELALARAKDEAEAAIAARGQALTARDEARREAERFAETLERNRAQLEEATRRKAEVEAEAAAAHTELQSSRKSASEMSGSAEKRRAQIEIDLAELATRKFEAEASLRAAQDETKKLSERRAELARAKDADEAAALKATAALKSASEMSGSAEKRCAQIEMELAVLATRKSEAEASLRAAQDEAKKLSERRAELARAKDADEAAASKAAAVLADAQSKLEAASTARDKIRAELASAAAAGAADAGKFQQATTRLKHVEDAAIKAERRLADATAALESVEARKREIDDSYASSKSLAAAAEAKRLKAAHAAEQAEALRSKREADADALASRIATLEAALKDADAQAKLAAAENAALAELTAKVTAQRKAVLELEGAKHEAQTQRAETEQSLARLRDEVGAAQAALEATQSALEAAQSAAAAANAGVELRRRDTDDVDAEAVAATVPPQVCAEALRTIESLAAEGEIPFEIAAELAGLIHEGRAIEALRVSRARANLEARPAPYLLATGDLSRDLGDASGAREAYRTLGAAEPGKIGMVHQRMGQLFLTFADQGTAAALQRDDAHYAATQEPAKALEGYADLVARFPCDPSFRQELGETHERLGNLDAAGLAYTQAMAQYLGSDDAAKAVELVPRLLAVRRESGDALELAARAFERAGRPDDAQLKLDEALAAYRHAKSASDVERVCRRLADIATDPVPYRRELAALLAEVGDASGAAEQLVEASERLIKWSNAADALSLLKEAAVLCGDNELLRERISAAKEKAAEAQRSTDQATRAAMFLSKKQFDKAVEAYRAAVDKNPYNADACYQLACLLTDHFPDYPTAFQLLENAAELRPGHTATRYRMAQVLAARGDVEQAVELLVALARFDENNADFIDQFVERLEKDADDGKAAAKYRLGIAYRELGRVEEALVILQSIQRDQDFIVLCLNAIGLCLRRQGLDTAAAKRFQKAIETPGYPETQYNEALYNLGDLYEAKHDPESLALSLSSFEELYARDCTYRDIADRIKSVKAKLGAAEGPKVKRLPNRIEAVNDR